MIQHVVVAGRPDRVAPLVHRIDEIIDRTSVLAGSPVRATDPAGRWAVAAVVRPDPFMPDRLAAEGDAMVLANGPVLAQAAPSEGILQRALRELRADPCSEVSADWSGIYHVVSASGEVVRATGDLSGLAPLYYGSGDGVTVISNRAQAIAEVLGLTGWNWQALSWVIAESMLIGPDLPIGGVVQIPPGSELRVGPDGLPVLRRSTSWVWPAPSDGGGRPDLDAAEWDAVTDDLIASFRSLASVDSPIKLFLTGGKDSRLTLALAAAAGLRDRILTVTTGAPTAAEAVHARIVARAAGFEHEMIGMVIPSGTPLVPRTPEQRSARRWELMREHVFRHEGTVATWDGLVDAGHSQLDIKGVGGEFFRRSGSRWMRSQPTASVDDLAAQMVTLHGKNRLKILRRPRHRANVKWLKAWVHGAAQEVRGDVINERFYAENALGHHNGTIYQNRPLAAKVAPLVSPGAVRRYLELSEQARGAERLHYEVMRRTVPELVAIPFLNDRWSPEIVGAPEPPPIEVERAEDAPATPAHNRRSWRWDFLATEGPAIGSLFAEAKDVGLGEVVDVPHLMALVTDPSQLTKPWEIKPIFGAIGASLLLLGRGQRVVDGA